MGGGLLAPGVHAGSAACIALHAASMHAQTPRAAAASRRTAAAVAAVVAAVALGTPATLGSV